MKQETTNTTSLVCTAQYVFGDYLRPLCGRRLCRRSRYIVKPWSALVLRPVQGACFFCIYFLTACLQRVRKVIYLESFFLFSWADIHHATRRKNLISFAWMREKSLFMWTQLSKLYSNSGKAMVLQNLTWVSFIVLFLNVFFLIVSHNRWNLCILLHTVCLDFDCNPRHILNNINGLLV